MVSRRGCSAHLRRLDLHQLVPGSSDVAAAREPGADEGGLRGVQGDFQLQAFAQLVQTATGLSGVRDVRFRIGGAPIDAPTDAGVSSEPVTRDDYASLAPAGG